MMADIHRPTNWADSDVLHAVETRWSAYRQGLGQADQPVFDRLFEHAHAHATASREHADAREVHHSQYIERAALVSMLIEQQKHIDDLEDRLDHLEDDLN